MDLISQMWGGVDLKHVQRSEDILSYLSFIGIIKKAAEKKNCTCYKNCFCLSTTINFCHLFILKNKERSAHYI